MFIVLLPKGNAISKGLHSFILGSEDDYTTMLAREMCFLDTDKIAILQEKWYPSQIRTEMENTKRLNMLMAKQENVIAINLKFSPKDRFEINGTPETLGIRENLRVALMKELNEDGMHSPLFSTEELTSTVRGLPIIEIKFPFITGASMFEDKQKVAKIITETVTKVLSKATKSVKKTAKKKGDDVSE